MTLLSGIADATQLTELTTLLDDYAAEAGLSDDKAGRERLAIRIMNLFNEGTEKPADIRRMLDASPHTWRLPVS
jgi:hypothetical protein